MPNSWASCGPWIRFSKGSNSPGHALKSCRRLASPELVAHGAIRRGGSNAALPSEESETGVQGRRRICGGGSVWVLASSRYLAFIHVLSLTLTTLALNQPSLRWFGACSCKPAAGPPHLFAVAHAFSITPSALVAHLLATIRPSANFPISFVYRNPCKMRLESEISLTRGRRPARGVRFPTQTKAIGSGPGGADPVLSFFLDSALKKRGTLSAA